MNQLRGQFRARGAERMAEGDRAAVHVDAILIHLQLAHRRDDLRRECFVELDQIDVAERHGGQSQRFRHGLDRAHIIQLCIHRI